MSHTRLFAAGLTLFRVAWSIISFLVLSSTWHLAAATDRVDRPNIIVILTDDHGYADVGFHGCQDIPTPHLDLLAKGGVICSDGYVTCPVCSPTRAGLLTGR